MLHTDADTDADKSTGASRRARLFLVEDHPLMRQMLRRLLEGEGDLSVVGEAASAEAVLAQLGESAPDLILIDLSLPGMNGLQLIKQLKGERPDLRCLVVTGHSDTLYKHAALAAGAAGFITKDNPDEVLAAVRSALLEN